MVKSGSRLFAAFALAAALAGEVQGQSAGSVTGSVKDASGAALPGASVTVTNPAQAVTQTAQTSALGVFVFPQLPPGTYSLKVELPGFKTVERSSVILTTRSAINVGDLVLEVGNVSETITVEADVGRLQIQTESAERSDLVERGHDNRWSRDHGN